MKHLLISLTLCLLGMLTFTNWCVAQDYQMSIKPNPANSFGSKDFWNITILSTVSSTKNVKLHGTVTSLQGQLLVEAFSGSVDIKSGFNSFDVSTVLTSSIRYHQSSIEQSDRSSRSFPAGSYSYCVEIIDPTSNEQKASVCSVIEVTVLNPPILVYPSNEDHVSERNPMLTWLPPSPLVDLSNVRYTVSVVEVYLNQNSGDAVLRNRPILYQKEVLHNTLQYPFNASVLEYGKKYAWQVEAQTTENTSLGVTEIWTFSLGIDSVEDLHISKDQSYIDIKKSDKDAIYYAVGDLRIKYISKYFPEVVHYRLVSLDNKIIAEGSNPLLVQSKDNRYAIPVDHDASLKHKQQYYIELITTQGDTYRLKFIYIDPIRIK